MALSLSRNCICAAIVLIKIILSQGTAEVVFSQRADALAAVKRYNNVQLDGKPMKLEIVRRNIAASAAAPPSNNGMYGNQNGGFRR